MNPELKNITTRKIISVLESDGFQLARSKGSHRIYQHPDGRFVLVAFHRSGATFPPKTLKSIIKAAQWTEYDLQRLRLIKS